jgi:hypothetical protein
MDIQGGFESLGSTVAINSYWHAAKWTSRCTLSAGSGSQCFFGGKIARLALGYAGRGDQVVGCNKGIGERGFKASAVCAVCAGRQASLYCADDMQRGAGSSRVNSDIATARIKGNARGS